MKTNLNLAVARLAPRSTPSGCAALPVEATFFKTPTGAMRSLGSLAPFLKAEPDVVLLGGREVEGRFRRCAAEYRLVRYDLEYMPLVACVRPRIGK